MSNFFFVLVVGMAFGFALCWLLAAFRQDNDPTLRQQLKTRENELQHALTRWCESERQNAALMRRIAELDDKQWQK